MSNTIEEVTQELVEENKNLTQVLSANIKKHGYLEPYDFFTEVSKYIVSEWNEDTMRWTGHFIGEFESKLTRISSTRTKYAISTMLLQPLPRPSDPYYLITEKIKPHMSSRLMKVLAIIESSNPYFIQEILTQFPNTQSIFYESIRDNDELLPHLFLSDITRSIIEEVSRRQLPSWIPRIVNYFESNLQLDKGDPVSNLITVSFLELLPLSYESSYETTEQLKEYMGPKLLKQLSLYESG